MKQASIVSDSRFQPHQIVRLKHESTCLYAELVEFVESRQVYWVRPLMLAVSAVDSNLLLNLYDLRFGADLLWPASLFQAALDTEVIPLLVELNAPDAKSISSSEAHKLLNSFVRRVWQAEQSAFSA